MTGGCSRIDKHPNFLSDNLVSRDRFCQKVFSAITRAVANRFIFQRHHTPLGGKRFRGAKARSAVE